MDRRAGGLPRPFELGNGQQLHVTVLDEVKTRTKRHFAMVVADFQEAWKSRN